MKDWLVIIPARLESSRLPEKPLQNLCGKPLVIRVYENLEGLSRMGAKIIVATDSDRVAEVCDREKVTVELTSTSHHSGTDRCFEVAERHNREYILNVQGDEPFCQVDSLINLCSRLKNTNWADMATIVHRVEDGKGFHDPNLVKVTLTTEGRAIYFSRSPIPYNRDEPFKDHPFYSHQGVYAFRKKALKRFVELQTSGLECSEKLEQLRALEHGMTILCTLSNQKSIGIDTPSDLEQARNIFKNRGV